jgi:DNA-binding MurR/RpiR family transcriptional regulator
MELVKKIKLNYYDLTPKLQQASQSILSNLHEIPFQTIRETAKKADVSALSISRLNKIWGFKGYSDFQSNVRLEYYPVGQTKNIFILSNLYEKKIENSILSAAKILTESNRVYISGFRSAKSFALYMNYMGRMVFDNFYLLPDSGLSAAQDIAHFSKNNLLVAFSTAPYSSETVRLIKTAQSLNVKTLSFTDSIISPLAQHSDYVVEVQISKVNRLNNMAPMITVIENVLEKCFEILGEEADKKIEYFSQRIKAINGYW